MALDLKPLDVTANQNRTFTVLDVTLAYSPTNLGGWGAPNPTIAEISSASLVVTLPDPTTKLPDPTNFVTFDAVSTPAFFDTFPNTTFLPFTFTNEDLGGEADTNIPDGIYQFDYSVTDATDTYTSSVYAVMDWAARCCLANLANGVNWKKCGCGSTDKNNFTKGWAYLWGVEANMVCPNITNAAAALVKAQEVCDGCGGCGGC